MHNSHTLYTDSPPFWPMPIRTKQPITVFAKNGANNHFSRRNRDSRICEMCSLAKTTFSSLRRDVVLSADDDSETKERKE